MARQYVDLEDLKYFLEKIKEAYANNGGELEKSEESKDDSDLSKK